MTIPIKIRAEKREACRALPEKLPLNNGFFSILKEEDDHIIIDLNPTYDLNAHIAELNIFTESDRFSVWQEAKKKAPPPVMSPISLSVEDLTHVKASPLSTLVWSNIFKKPDPVQDLTQWAESDAFDCFIYVPNCTTSIGSEEDCTSNANYTQVMLNAYQNMCVEERINPTVLLKSGKTKKALSLSTFDAVQPTEQKERASGLAGSSLVDFDDSAYANKFLESVSKLPARQYSKEPAKMAVLAKSEFILAGKFSHVYNQKFVKKFLEALANDFEEEFSCAFKDRQTEVQATLVNLMRNMVMCSMVLIEESDYFESNVWGMGLGEANCELIMRIYRSVGEV